MARFFCMTVDNNSARKRCEVFVKDDWKFLIKFLFLGLKFAKVTLFHCFSFSFSFFQIIYFEYLKNEYTYAN